MSDATPRGDLLRMLKARRDEVRYALLFLTRLPVGHIAQLPPLAHAAWAFPIVGAVHGLIIGLGYWAAHVLGLSNLVCALLAVLAGVVASGALHEDGLADCVDGFGGGWTRARKLEIMRDSRVGTYGVIALIIALGLRISLYAEISKTYDVLCAAVGLGALTRGFLPLAMALLPAARKDGAAAEAAARLSSSVVGVSAVLSVTIALVLLGPSGLLAIGACLCAMSAMFLVAVRQIGGQTGDVLGAAHVIGEIAGLLAIATVLAP
ncbi:MAG TPA: adenosylcobinamide-GDP ribazoletransferase [Hyphomicrobiaceae bacterium]|nr:adenosylcobinamide-GDP ribazoletransferase [Hyphomicrobiaceae bacterium]